MKLSNIFTLSTASTGALASHRHIAHIYAREDSNISRPIFSRETHNRQLLVPSHLTRTNTSSTSTSSNILRAGSPVAHTASCTTKNEPLSTSELVLLEVLFDERVPETQTTYADWLITYLSKLTSDIYAVSNDAINFGGLSFTSNLESVDANGILKLASAAPLYSCYLSSVFEDAISTPYTIQNGLTPEENGKLVALFEKRGDTSNYGYNLADEVDALVSHMHEVAAVVATATDLSYTSYFSLLDVQELFSMASDAPIYTSGLSSAFSSALSEYSSQTTVKVTTTKNLTVTHSLLGYHAAVSIPSTSAPQSSDAVSSAGELTSYVYNTSTLKKTTTVTSCSLESDASKIELLHQVHTTTAIVTVTICDDECKNLHSIATAAISTITITGTTTIAENGSTTESAITKTTTTCDEECQSKASAASYAVSTIVSTFVTTITEVETSAITSQSAVAVPINAQRAVNTETVTDIETLVNTETIVTTVTICEGDCESLRSVASEAVKTVTVTDITTIAENGSTVESTITETVTTCDAECQSKASAASYAVSTIVSTFVTIITEVETSAITSQSAVATSQSAVAVPINAQRAINAETLATTITICEGDCVSLRSAASKAVRTISVTDVTTIVENGSTTESAITKTTTTCDEECQSKASAASYAVSTIVSTFVTAETLRVSSAVAAAVKNGTTSGVTTTASSQAASSVSYLRATMKDPVVTVSICDEECMSIRRAAASAIDTITLASTVESVANGSTLKSVTTELQTTCDVECESKVSEAEKAVRTSLSTVKGAADATTPAGIATAGARNEKAGSTPATAHVTTTVAPVRGATAAATDVNATERGTTTKERADDKKDGQKATMAAQATPAAYTHSTSYVAAPRAGNTVSVSAQVMNGAAKGGASKTWVVLMAGLVLLI